MRPEAASWKKSPPTGVVFQWETGRENIQKTGGMLDVRQTGKRSKSH